MKQWTRIKSEILKMIEEGTKCCKFIILLKATEMVRDVVNVCSYFSANKQIP